MFIDIFGILHYCVSGVLHNCSLSSLPLKILIALSVCFTGCLKKTPPENLLKSERVYLHLIQYPGETLETISLWYTGSNVTWKKIREYNAHVKLSILPIGGVIRIPESVMTTKEPMPEQFVQQHKRKVKKETRKKTPGQIQNSEESEEDEGEVEPPSDTPDLDAQDELIDKLLAPSYEESSPNPEVNKAQ